VMKFVVGETKSCDILGLKGCNDLGLEDLVHCGTLQNV
jgi:hypothetical protein